MRLASLQAAEAHVQGRAVRSATVCHRALLPDPLTVVAFQLGAEPFSVAALGWGHAERELRIEVAGDPRNRDLAFDLLTRFAHDFNPWFEAPYADREVIVRPRSGRERQVAPTIPQLVVPNRDTAMLLGRLGRRLAYLSLDGEWPADPALVRLGRHLVWLRLHAAVPGQQILVSLADLLADHWDVALNDWERVALPALDAYIEPPDGVHGHIAAAAADRVPLGPRPDGDQDRALEPQLEAFNRARAGSAARATVEPLLGPIRAHYTPLLERAWQMSWRCLERERAWRPARFVDRRLEADRVAYSDHMQWVETADGIRRTRQTVAQAIKRVRQLEADEQRLAAEQAADDPLKMIDLLATGEAIAGRVVEVDLAHTEPGPRRSVRRPLFTVELDGLCPLLPGDEVHWSCVPDKAFVVHEVQGSRSAERVVLRLEHPQTRPLPERGEHAWFSLAGTAPRWIPNPPAAVPWTHAGPHAAPASIEDDSEQAA